MKFIRLFCALFAFLFLVACASEEEAPAEQRTIFRSPRATADPGYNVINREWDNHAQVVMENSIEKQNTPEEFCQATPKHLVFFRIYYDCGYDFVVDIRGHKTNKTYSYEWIEADDLRNNLGFASYGFYMPDEEVTITATSFAKTTYADEGFTGDYNAFQIVVGRDLTTIGNGKEANIKLFPSTRFEVTESDGKSYSGEYEMDESHYSFFYKTDDIGLHRDMNAKSGLQGFWYGGDDIMGVTVDIEDNRPETHRYYYSSKQPFTYKCVAESSYGKRFLLEIKKQGQHRQWFYFYPETYRFYELTTNDLDNTAAGIDGQCDVLFYNEGEPFLHYTRKQGELPTFRYMSSERGTYKSAGADDLVLDGLGRAEWGNIKGNYTIDGINVHFTSATLTKTGDFISAAGNGALERQTEVTGIIMQDFVIDNSDMTYKCKQDVIVVTLAENWNCEFSESDNAAFWDGSATRGSAYIQLEHDFSGKVKEGYAGVHIKIFNKSFFRDDDFISATVPYVFDIDKNTLTLKDVLQGNGGTGSVKKDIVFKLVNNQLVGTSKVYMSGSATRYIDFSKLTIKGE